MPIKLAIHPACQIFPDMSDQEFEELKKDIEAHGQQEPIVVMGKQIIDGRHRYKACQQLKIKPKLSNWKGNGIEVIDFVVAKNLHRRHLTTEQRAFAAARLSTFEHGGDRSKPPNGGLKHEDAAERMDVGLRTTERAAAVVAEGSSALVKATEAGEIPLSVAAQAARALPVMAQKKALQSDNPVEALKKATAKANPKTVEEVKEATRALRSGKATITPALRKATTHVFGKLVRQLHKMKLKDKLEKPLNEINNAVKHAI